MSGREEEAGVESVVADGPAEAAEEDWDEEEAEVVAPGGVEVFGGADVAKGEDETGEGAEASPAGEEVEAAETRCEETSAESVGGLGLVCVGSVEDGGQVGEEASAAVEEDESEEGEGGGDSVPGVKTAVEGQGADDGDVGAGEDGDGEAEGEEGEDGESEGAMGTERRPLVGETQKDQAEVEGVGDDLEEGEVGEDEGADDLGAHASRRCPVR